MLDDWLLILWRWREQEVGAAGRRTVPFSMTWPPEAAAILPQINATTVPQNKPRCVPFTFFPIHTSSYHLTPRSLKPWLTAVLSHSQTNQTEDKSYLVGRYVSALHGTQSLSPCSTHPIAGSCLGLPGPRSHLYNTASLQRKLLARDDEPMARVPKMARDIHCCANLFHFARPASKILRRICVYIYTHTCAEFVYQLPLLPDNTVSEIFLHRSVGARSVDRIFTIGTPSWRWLGDYVTLGRTFWCLLLKQGVAAATVTATFDFFFAFIVEASIKNI